ncbi:MAG: hypothetical protein ACLQUW_03205 [Desulfobaccales bacterium]
MDMSLHYGPKWCWDQNRPEAIEARLEMAKFHKKLQERRQRRQDIQEAWDFLAHSPARHFLLSVKHLGMGVVLLLISLKNLAKSHDFPKFGRQKGRCA